MQTHNTPPSTEITDNKDSYKFSFFTPPIGNLVPSNSLSVNEIHEYIVSDKYAPVTEQLRQIIGEKAQKKFKRENLHYVTFSGIFTKRGNDHLVSHSKLICVDIDSINHDRVKKLKQEIPLDYNPVLMFTGPRGNGLKVVYCIDTTTNNHLDYFYALQSYFYRQHGVNIDKACKDVSRACFLCHDPEAHKTDTPAILDQSFIDTFYVEPVHNNDIDILTKACKMVLNAPDGQKHNTLLNAARLCGGAIAAGTLDETDAIQRLEAAINTRNIDSFEVAQKTIIDGITHGKTEPIYETATASNKIKPKPVPPLPIDGLPEAAQDIIKHCSDVMGTPRDFWAQSFLAATALAIGASVTLRTKYRNNAVFWFVCVGDSGKGKSEPDKLFFNHFHEIDSEAINTYNTQYAEYKRIMKLTKTERAAQGIQDIPPHPVLSQYILTDTTPEALIQANFYNYNGVCVVRDELAGLINDFGRYSKSGEQQNWLSSWSQAPMTVNRKSGEVLKINRPFINITGGIQPAVLPDLSKDNREKDGFLPRVLFAYPDRHERAPYTEKRIAEDVSETIKDYLNNLLKLRHKFDLEDLTLSSEAAKLYEEFYNHNTYMVNNTTNSYFKEMYAKLDIYCLRLAILVHCSKWAMTGVNEQQVTPETMTAAINLAEYYRLTGEKVHLMINSNPADLDPKTVARYLQNRGASQNQIASAMKLSQPYINKILK